MSFAIWLWNEQSRFPESLFPNFNQDSGSLQRRHQSIPIAARLEIQAFGREDLIDRTSP
jgi:hypothetical protein